MNREEALALLNAKLDEYRRLGYVDLAARVGSDEVAEAVGSSGAEYQIEIQVMWDHKPGGDVRVMGGIDDGGWRAFMPLSNDLIVSPGGNQ